MLPTQADPQSHTRLVMRAVAFPDLPHPTWAAVLDLPLSQVVEQRIADETGIRIGEVDGVAVRIARERRAGRGPAARADAADPLGGTDDVAHHAALGGVSRLHRLGHRHAVGRHARDADQRLGRSTSASRPPRRAWARSNFGQLLLAVLALVGGLFLIIQFVALVIGLLLARQITGAVHDLFTGTQHLRNRDFAYTIPVARATSSASSPSRSTR